MSDDDVMSRVHRARTRECVAMPGKRKQDIHTPDVIVDKVHQFYGGILPLDPATVESNPTRASRFYTPIDDGLAKPWDAPTFCNPPYNKLKDWLAKARSEEGPIIFLCPVRTNRAWFYLTTRESGKGAWDVIHFLRPVKFNGYDQAFPVSCMLAYKGHNNQRKFIELFQDLSTMTLRGELL